MLYMIPCISLFQNDCRGCNILSDSPSGVGARRESVSSEHSFYLGVKSHGKANTNAKAALTMSITKMVDVIVSEVEYKGPGVAP